MKTFLDTSILVDYLRGFKPSKSIVDKVRGGQIDAYISALTEAELLSGSECQTEDRLREVLALVSQFKKLDVDNDICRTAGEFKRNYNLSLADCIIAATASAQEAKLWTRDLKDFKRIKEIDVESPYS